MYTEQLTTYERFEVELSLAESYCKEGLLELGRTFLYNVIDLCEQHLKDYAIYKELKAKYTEIHDKYFKEEQC